MGIVALQDNSAHKKIMESLIGNGVAGSCPDLSNWCIFGLDNQQAGSYTPATELEIISFWPSPFGELATQNTTEK